MGDSVLQTPAVGVSVSSVMATSPGLSWAGEEFVPRRLTPTRNSRLFASAFRYWRPTGNLLPGVADTRILLGRRLTPLRADDDPDGGPVAADQRLSKARRFENRRGLRHPRRAYRRLIEKRFLLAIRPAAASRVLNC